MTLAKATVTGTVYRAPEKRFTQNDIAVYGLTLNIGETEELLIRVISKRRVLADLLDNVKIGDKLLVDGRLQVATTKTDGSEKKYYEIDANDIEIISGTGSNTQSNSVSTTSKGEVEFGEFEAPVFAEEAEEDLIGEEEIPF